MYQFISIVAKPLPVKEMLTQTNMEGVSKEYELAMKAPAMLEALQKAQKALLFSRPHGTITPEIEANHKAVHQLVCDVLLDLNELK